MNGRRGGREPHGKEEAYTDVRRTRVRTVRMKGEGQQIRKMREERDADVHLVSVVSSISTLFSSCRLV